MPVIALEPGYTGEVRDRVENFHGNQLVYFGWPVSAARATERRMP